MEAKLKSLRVADLRELLQKASVAIPAKANKADLIAKILASPAAIETFNNPGSSAVSSPKHKTPAEPSQGGQDDDLLAPPEEFDWGPAASNGAQASPVVPAVAAPKADSKLAVPKPVVTPGTAVEQSIKKTEAPSTDTGPSETVKDEELEKRKKRAARFGIALVETKPKATPVSNGAKTIKGAPKAQNISAEEAAKIESRAARFATGGAANTTTGATPAVTAATSPTSGKKRARSPAPVDQEEMARRKRRAERFSSGGEATAQS